MIIEGTKNTPEGSKKIWRGKTIIAGGRDLIIPRASLYELFKKLRLWPTEVVSGKEPYGVDKCGELFADYYSIPVKPFPADWDAYGKAAGPIRNAHMACYADILVAFWNGSSKGTHDMIRNMVLQTKPFHVELILEGK